MGNLVSSMFSNSDEAKNRKNNLYYKKQYDSYISGNAFMLSTSESMKSIDDLNDYNKWSKNFVSQNADNPHKIAQYIKKQNLDSVKESISGNYEQAYRSLLIAEATQGVAQKRGVKFEIGDILPIEEALLAVSGKLTPDEKVISNTVAIVGLNKMVNDVAYQNGQLRQKDVLEQNVSKGYAMTLNDISKKDYMQGYGGFSIIKGVNDIIQKEYTSRKVQEQVRGVAPQNTSFTDRDLGISARQI